MSKAVVMTVCQRPFYLKPVLDGWMKVRGYQDWPFIFMVENTPTRDAMIAVIEEFNHPNKTVVLNAERLGVLENPFAGLAKAFDIDRYEFVVLAEEDLLPSTNILEFFDVAHGAMIHNSRILAACAQGLPDLEPEGWKPKPYELELKQSFKVWLWGTTHENWYLYIRDTWDHNYSTGTQYQSGWDWNLDLRVLPELNMKCLFPKTSLVDNLGQWLGAHASPSEYEASRPLGFVQDVPYSPDWTLTISAENEQT